MTTTPLAVPTETLWLLDSLAQVRVSREEGDGHLSVVELTAPRGSMPPLHVHDEDETLYLLEGTLTLFAGERVTRLAAGDSALAPRGVPHTYVAEAEATRMLVVGEGGFERFLRAAGRPSEQPTLPPTDGPPSAGELAEAAVAAAEHGIRFVGPPGMLPSDLA
jgi:quercetin dioxygenase-like cupin family protein